MNEWLTVTHERQLNNMHQSDYIKIGEISVILLLYDVMF